ncbi:pseudouridine synthase [Murimonas intestini]|uniref:Pseudouridine synthase n=1 Tax=Murimonas intestini TaxID=1337051 RepID=A0AB73T745_9FIRM|nr:pseudouridine synthase [Murimonas intestini]MCR1841328.1 pseudouridine synthase [Murimonas intestini]MCR1866246.1 pseudouridine synthase [Murimonas intestini]MCR1882637.1 pseudouridine synthase [Murimonas intestini]
MRGPEEREFTDRDINGPVRLNKYISECGICSRREADRLIGAGEVTVDGSIAVSGMKVLPCQEVKVKGKLAVREEEMVILAFHKPAGVVCTTDKRWGDVTAEEAVGYHKRLFYVGRLDKDSEGLLLMTNDGEILNKIMRAGNYHEKEYEVTVDKPIDGKFLEGMEKGVPILDTVTRPCRVRKLGKNRFSIILTQGLNRQIRRMCEYFGYRVTRLVRTRVMNIRLEGLKSGEYREVTGSELSCLKSMLKDSRSGPPSGRPGQKRKIMQKTGGRNGK